MKKILCMGSINIDLVMYMDRMPMPGETLVTDNFRKFPGGKGGNQAAAASILGGDVVCFTKLGDDEFSRLLIQEQKAGGVDMNHVLVQPGETAGIAMIRVDGKGQNSISFTPGANRLLTPEDVRTNQKLFTMCQILLITMEIDCRTVYEAVRIAKEHGMTVILDPAPAPIGGIPEEIAHMVDYVKPNETEAETLTGIRVTDRDSAIAALKALKQMGFKSPIVTLAGQGAVTYMDERPLYVPSFQVDSVDSTAAGDIFLGAFTAALAADKSYGACLDYARAAAAVSTTRKGAQSSIPTVQEVMQYLQ